MVERLHDKIDCQLCEDTWALYGKVPTNCGECMPEALPGNVLILDIFGKVQNQHIMGFNGPVDLNFESLRFIMDVYDIKDKISVFERVYKAYQTSTRKMREKVEIERIKAEAEKEAQHK